MQEIELNGRNPAKRARGPLLSDVLDGGGSEVRFYRDRSGCATCPEATCILGTQPGERNG